MNRLDDPKPITRTTGWSLDRLRPWQQAALALAFFMLLTLWMLWNVVANMGRSIEGWGDALLQVWTIDWDAHALATDPFNLFNANAFYPYNNSLAFSESLIGQAFLVTPVIWLTGNPVLGYNLLLLVSFVLSGWGMYLLALEITESRVGALVAGIIFAFFPHRFGQLSHLHLLATQWMPFCLLFLRRFLVNGRWRNAALFALFFALQALSSTYLGLFLVAAIGLYLLYHGLIWLFGFIRQLRAKNKEKDPAKPNLIRTIFQNKLVKLAVATLVAGLVILPFYLPFLTVQSELGFERSPSEVASFSAQPFYFLDVAKENKLNQWLYKPNFSFGWWDSSRGGERGLYLGLIATLLGLAGLVVAWRWRKREKDSLFYALLALVAISFTFGPVWQSGRFGSIPLPYALLYNYLPGFQGLRVPVRFIYVVALAIAVLGAMAIAALQAKFKLTTPRRAALLAITLVALLCLEYVSDVNIKDSDALSGPPPAVNTWLAAQPSGAVLNVPLSGSDYTNLFYQYWSREGWQPVMNGFSGFMPPAYDALRRMWQSEFPSPRLVELLQGLDVRYLVIDSAAPEVAPTWDKTRKAISDKFSGGLVEAKQFGSTYVYEIIAGGWVRSLSRYIKPGDPVYLASYNRNDPQILDLVGYYLFKSGTVKRENLYGSINLGFKQLPALPFGQAPRFLLLQAGEDPTLYGFKPEDKLFGNSLLDLYRANTGLLARYDFSRTDPVEALQGKLATINLVEPNRLEFNSETKLLNVDRYVRVAFAATKTSQVELVYNDTQPVVRKIQLEPGLSFVTVNLPRNVFLGIRGDKVAVASVELWDGTTPDDGKVELRPDVVVLSASTRQDGSDGLAALEVVPKGGQANNYTATLDVYNYPWGSHPSGHYGYWSVAVPGGQGSSLEFRLNLPGKQMATKLNGGNVPNYPPDPKDLDLNSYGRVGDFRANLNLYAGDKLIGSVRLFDFTVHAAGDRANAANRRLDDFKGYQTPIALLVLPPEKK